MIIFHLFQSDSSFLWVNAFCYYFWDCFSYNILSSTWLKRVLPHVPISYSKWEVQFWTLREPLIFKKGIFVGILENFLLLGSSMYRMSSSWSQLLIQALVYIFELNIITQCPWKWSFYVVSFIVNSLKL